VPVEIATENGTVRTDLVLDGARTSATIGLDAAPVSVRIDPDYALFRRLLPGEAPPILRDVLLDGSTRTLVLYDDAARSTPARQLAERLFDGSTPPSYGEPGAPPDTALLMIGPAQEIEAFIKRRGVAAASAEVAGKGSARAWVAQEASGKAMLFVEAESAEDLQALARWLPHYRAKSFVVLDGGRVVTSGILPAPHSPLVRQLP
jgi:aminopeptidase N